MRRLVQIVHTSLACSLTACSLLGGSAGLKHADNYKFTPGQMWKEIKRDDSDAAFRLKSGSIVTLISSCRPEVDIKLETLTRQLTIGLRDIEWKSQSPHNSGLLSEIDATFEGAKITMLVFVTQNNSCSFDISMLNRIAISDADRSEFLKFVDSIKFVQTKD